MSDKHIELDLLIFSETEIASGLSLANRIAARSGFHARVTVVAEQPAGLLKQVETRVASLPPEEQSRFIVESLDLESEELIIHLNRQEAMRLLVVAGLDQLNDQRRAILSQTHVSVVCFEPHPGLEPEPRGLWLVGEDEGQAVHWLCDHFVSNPLLKSTTVDELTAAADASAALAHQPNDLVFIGAAWNDIGAKAKLAKTVIQAAVGPVLLVREELPTLAWILDHQLPMMVARFVPQMTRETRRALSTALQDFSKLDFEFIALLSASTFLASFGLLQNSAAVIIGAMLIAPLMTPILGAGLSLAHGNRPLFRESLKTIFFGFIAAMFTSFCFGMLVRFGVPSILDHDAAGRVILTNEMWSRSHPTWIDFLVGLVGGSAAAFARTRTHLADALAGAAIAAALVPPLATAGLQLSFVFLEVAPAPGTDDATHVVYGPILLFAANMLTIMIGSSFVLWACGARSDHSHSTKERWTTRMTALLMTLTAIILVWILQDP